MKKSLLFVAAAAMFVFAGCNKEQLAQELKSNNVIHIGVKQIAPLTKVAAVDIAANKLSFKWEEGDQVSFTDNDNYEKIIIYTCTNPATGEFSGEALNPDATYWVEYPNDYSGTFIYRGNQIPKGHFITNKEEVSGSATTFTLDTHDPIIHFKLKGDAKIGKIKLSNAQEDQPIYTLSCGDEGVQLSDEPIDFYMDAQLLDKNRLSDYAYTLSIRDIQDAELKSVSFHLKAENLGTIVDFATPIEVNAGEFLTNAEIIKSISDAYKTSGKAGYVEYTIKSASGDWQANANVADALESLTLKNNNYSHLLSPEFSGNITKIELVINKTTMIRSFYALPVSTELTEATYTNTIFDTAYGSATCERKKEQTITIVFNKNTKRFKLIVADGTAYIDAIKVYHN